MLDNFHSESNVPWTEIPVRELDQKLIQKLIQKHILEDSILNPIFHLSIRPPNNPWLEESLQRFHGVVAIVRILDGMIRLGLLSYQILEMLFRLILPAHIQIQLRKKRTIVKKLRSQFYSPLQMIRCPVLIAYRNGPSWSLMKSLPRARCGPAKKKFSFSFSTTSMDCLNGSMLARDAMMPLQIPSCPALDAYQKFP